MSELTDILGYVFRMGTEHKKRGSEVVALAEKQILEAEEGIEIENEGEDPAHIYYSYSGTPLRSLDCSCERCLNYFLDN